MDRHRDQPAVSAVIVSPELGAAYLGTQGDEWDAQKDAALAFAGAVVAMGVTWNRGRWLQSVGFGENRR